MMKKLRKDRVMMKTLIGIGFLLGSGLVTQAAGLDSPLELQVYQRNAAERADVLISGSVPADTTLVEARAELAAGLKGKATDWIVVARGGQVKDGKFSGTFTLVTGGWYTIRVRFRKSAVVQAVLEELAVKNVGVGDIFVVAGQSNSANHGQEKQQPKTGLVVAFDGKHWQVANDPQPGASGGAGSFMPAFGDAIAKKLRVPVGIVACGAGGTSVRAWLPEGTRMANPPTNNTGARQLPGGEWESDGRLYNGFVSRMKQLGPNGFRAVLWHQGESDANQPDPKQTLTGRPYRLCLEQVIMASRKDIGWNAPWFVALVSSHGNNEVPELRAAQKSLWDDGIALEGPDSDALKGDLRDGVHFSAKGLREHGLSWAEKVAPWLEKQTHGSSPRKK